MNKLFYIAIGFVIGIVMCLYLGLRELVGKLTKDKMKKLYKIFIEDK